MKRMNLSLAALALLGVIVAGCGSTIPAGSKGVYRGFFEGTRDTAYDDGFKWHWPWNNVTSYDVRWQSYTEQLNVLSQDNLHMTVDLSVRLRPAQADVFRLHTDSGPRYYSRVVQQAFRSIALDVLSGYAYHDIPKMTGEIQGHIRDRLQEDLQGKFLEFDDVEIRHVNYPPEVIKATSNKLATQELAEQKEYEKLIAEAEAQIQIIDARGQQEAQEIIQSTLTPIYLQFQALEVQQQLARNPNSVFYFVPLGNDGLPMVFEAPLPTPAVANPTTR